jgi:DNA-binding LytR/AlgR family response regulator
LERLSRRPLVIALTAHPQHAVRGFSLDLVDYILKPVEIDRLRSAIKKARHRMASAPLAPGRTTFLAEMEGKKVLLELNELLVVESMGNYVVLHTSRGRGIKRATFKQVQDKLPPVLFLETSRGCMVAKTEIASWKRDPQGHLVLMLSSGSSLRVARSRTTAILKVLQGT